MRESRKRKQPRSAVQASKDKVPTAVARATSGRQPVALPVPSIEHLRLSWRFGRADTGGPWCFSDCDAATVHQIIAKLTSFESMSIAELRGDLLKSYPIEQLPSSEAARRLIDLDMDDQTEIHRLRLTGANRLYGLLDDEGVFHILWWDPKHQIWPSKKKHT